MKAYRVDLRHRVNEHYGEYGEPKAEEEGAGDVPVDAAESGKKYLEIIYFCLGKCGFF